MEPISAIGLVGDIIGLIDAGLRSVEVARRIYHSATGSTLKNENLVFVAGEVRKRAMVLQVEKLDLNSAATSKGKHALLSDDEKSLDAIAKKCRDIVDDLLALLGSL